MRRAWGGVLVCQGVQGVQGVSVLDSAPRGRYNRQTLGSNTTIQRRIFVTKLTSVVLVSALVAAGTVSAQQKPEPLLQVAVFKTKPGKGAAWVAAMKKLYVPMLEKLMAEGAVQSYGIESDVLHQAGVPDVSAWFTVPNYTAYDKVSNAIREIQASNAPALQEIADSTDMEKHSDYLLRIVSSSQKPVAASARPYSTVGSWQVKRGKGEEFRKGFDKYEKPVLDKLLADGVILGYMLVTEAVHSAAPGKYWLSVVTPSLASEDKIEAAFRADEAKRSELERAALQREFEELTEAGSHRDFISRAEVFVTK